MESPLQFWPGSNEHRAKVQGRRIGLIDDALHREVEAARGQVLAFLAARQGPFAEDLSGWRPDPAWPLPALHPDALNVPTELP